MNFSGTFCLFLLTAAACSVREQLDYCSLVMSVTVPRLTKLPSESETETTALTTADLSSLLVSTLELATP